MIVIDLSASAIAHTIEHARDLVRDAIMRVFPAPRCATTGDDVTGRELDGVRAAMLAAADASGVVERVRRGHDAALAVATWAGLAIVA